MVARVSVGSSEAATMVGQRQDSEQKLRPAAFRVERDVPENPHPRQVPQPSITDVALIRVRRLNVAEFAMIEAKSATRSQSATGPSQAGGFLHQPPRYACLIRSFASRFAPVSARTTRPVSST